MRVINVPPVGMASSAFSIKLLNTSWSCCASASTFSICLTSFCGHGNLPTIEFRSEEGETFGDAIIQIDR